MKIAALLLLAAGWMLVLSALQMLNAGGARSAFVGAGLAVEVLGLVLAMRAQVPVRSDRG